MMTMGDGRWAMGDGRWAMGDGRWAMGDGRLMMTMRGESPRMVISLPALVVTY
jgi:hypothetical protein